MSIATHCIPYDPNCSICNPPAVEHKEQRIEVPRDGVLRLDGTGFVSRCSCGARWSHPSGRTVEQMDSIFESHVAYFKRVTAVL